MGGGGLCGDAVLDCASGAYRRECAHPPPHMHVHATVGQRSGRLPSVFFVSAAQLQWAGTPAVPWHVALRRRSHELSGRGNHEIFTPSLWRFCH